MEIKHRNLPSITYSTVTCFKRNLKMSSVTQTSDTKYLLDFIFFSSKPVEQRLNKARGSQTLSCPKENTEQRNIGQMMCEGIN